MHGNYHKLRPFRFLNGFLFSKENNYIEAKNIQWYSNFLWELKKMNVKFHKAISYTLNFQNFPCVITLLVKFDIHFL